MAWVEVVREPPIRFVHLDAGARNVLTLEAVRALRGAFVDDDEAPVVVLTGREDGFCAGLDNATLAAGPAERDMLLANMGELLLAVLEGTTRTVVACAGHAVAAGAMLLLVADVRLAVPGRYKVGFTEPGLGMPLPELPALLARERLDRRRLHAFTALGRVVGPEEAAEVGFFDALVPTEILRAEATERAKEIARLTPAAYRGSLTASWGPRIDQLRLLVDRQRRRAEKAAD